MNRKIVAVMLLGASFTLVCTGGCAARYAARTGETIAFADDEAMRTMNTPVPITEFMLYSVGVKTAYDETMGDGFYAAIGTNAHGVDEPYENIVKEEIAESIRMVRVLCAAAETEYGITISADEEKLLKENACAYYEQMTQKGVDEAFLAEETVCKFVREEYLAGKVYAHLEKMYTDKAAAITDAGNAQTHADACEQELRVDADALAGAIAGLMERYDGAYSYVTNINWDLMDAFSFQKN